LTELITNRNSMLYRKAYFFTYFGENVEVLFEIYVKWELNWAVRDQAAFSVGLSIKFSRITFE